MGPGAGGGHGPSQIRDIIRATIKGRPRAAQPGPATVDDLLKALRLKEEPKKRDQR